MPLAHDRNGKVPSADALRAFAEARNHTIDALWLSSQRSPEQHDAGTWELLGKPISLRILTDWHAIERNRDNLSSAMINMNTEMREALCVSQSE